MCIYLCLCKNQRKSRKLGTVLLFDEPRRAAVKIIHSKSHAISSFSMDSYADSYVQNSKLITVFQENVDKICYGLLVAKGDEFLSIAWVKKLLDGFVSCQEGFQFMVDNNKSQFSEPATERLVSELLDRSVKALDIFKATRDGIEEVRHWLRHVEIVLSALNPHQRMMGEGQVCRARKAMDSAILGLDEKETDPVLSREYQSFGGRSVRDDDYYYPPGNLRSVSLGVPRNSRSWSATKQLELLADKLRPPIRNEIADTHGLAVPIYTMNFIMLFVLWALVAVLPRQNKKIYIHFEFPRQSSLYPWSTPLYMIHGRIIEESNRQKQSCSGLLKEIFQIKRCMRYTTDLVESITFPLTEDLKEEVGESVKEFSPLFEVAKTELDPLERHVRTAFRKIMSSRSDLLEILGKATEP